MKRLAVVLSAALLLAACGEETLMDKAEKGDAQAQYQVGRQFEKEGKEVDATKWYKVAADQNHADAQYALGELSAKTAEGFRIAAETGSTTPIKFFKVNYEKAAEWYEKAAILGHVEASLRLAKLHLNGLGVSADATKAQEWAQKAADKGSAEAKKIVDDIKSGALTATATDFEKAAVERARIQPYR